MDGNGRWAQAKGLPRFAGHQAGAKMVREIVECAAELGLEVLTLYAFSHENWKRPKKEISLLMSLLEYFLEAELKNLLENDIRLQAIGRLEALPPKALSKLRKTIQATRHNKGLVLNLALNYGSRQEILDAVKRIVADPPHEITEATISGNLYTRELPDPDLLIRTSGEMRLSNFLLWQISYAEIYITEKFWPDFKKAEFLKAMDVYKKRERRFGAVKA